VTSISTIGSSPYQSSWQSPFQQISSNFQQLGQSLSSGNLSGAQQAFSSLQQLLPGGQQGQSSSTSSSTSGTQGSGNSTIQQDMAALGQALQSGNLSDAQQAYAQLQQDFQAGRHHGHHHHAQSASNATQSTAQNSSSSSSSPDAASTTSGTTTDLSISVQISETSVNILV